MDLSHQPQSTIDTDTDRRISRRVLVLLLVILIAGIALRVGISVHRGEALVRQGKQEAALVALKKAVNLDPDAARYAYV